MQNLENGNKVKLRKEFIGKVLAADVISEAGVLLIPKNKIISEKIYKNLIKNKISVVYIKY